MRALVVVPTLGNRRLGPLVNAIASQCKSAAAAGHDCEALVLHNGSTSAAIADVCRAVGSAYATHEPRGYSEIRNEAIRRAVAEDFDVLVMIDDDELPGEGWLTALLAPFHIGADVVVGPVTTVWPESAPSRFVRSGLPRSDQNRSDGWIDEDLRTGNCALRIRALGSTGFDRRFNASGGEDTILFRQLRAAGARCFWAQSASVAELVDEDRVRLAYFAGRMFAQGRTLASIQRLSPRHDDVRGWALMRTRMTRAMRLLWWAARERETGHVYAAACEVALSAGYATSRWLPHPRFGYHSRGAKRL